MRKFFRYSFIFLLLSWWAGGLRATVIDDLLPQTFVRITSLESLNSESYYILASLGSSGKFSFLSNQVVSSSVNKFKGYTHTEGYEDSFSCSKSVVVWQLGSDDGENFYLYSAESSEYLVRKSDGALGLALSSSNQSSAEWTVSLQSDGTFLFLDATYSSRGLSTGTVSAYSGDVYDNYTNPGGLYIYKMETSYSVLPGAATLPEDGTIVALSNNQLALSSTGEVVDISASLLLDGSLAPEGDFTQWVCSHTSDEAFVLKSLSGSTYLGENLTSEATAFEWEIYNGHIATTDESSRRFLCFIASEETWAVLDEEEAQERNAVSGLLRSVGDEPTSSTSKAGVKTLGGAWSANELQALDWTGVQCLDLTEISLPVNLQSFAYSPETPNLPIFVAEEAENYIPEDWNFVVSCSSTGNTLLRTTELVDKQPFYSDRDISVSANQLTYIREAWDHDLWQTICLPFTVTSLPSECFAAEFVDITNAGAEFEEVFYLDAGDAYVIWFTSTSARESCTEISFSSAACTLASTPRNENAYVGTFEQGAVTSSDDGIYLIPATGEGFQLAPQGSTLPPFRAYLQVDAEQARKMGQTKNLNLRKYPRPSLLQNAD